METRSLNLSWQKAWQTRHLNQNSLCIHRYGLNRPQKCEQLYLRPFTQNKATCSQHFGIDPISDGSPSTRQPRRVPASIARPRPDPRRATSARRAVSQEILPAGTLGAGAGIFNSGRAHTAAHKNTPAQTRRR
ncbi:hypothetical protein EVAR_62146_1 [Eumeta japonica]|uniref:Uncharacterized protein n=1 Tax=Eumeta variegata TaxID=151549 RepID=A0A4C1ZJD5_EUMVA|nr:hypothetical protein EVAR_62146_1 [Eumeta japonica]